MASTILLSDNGATSGISGYQLTGGTDGTLTVQTTTSGGTPTTAVSIDNTQNTTVAGNLTLSGTGKRITGDFSNATVANRVMFQTSTANSFTSVDAIPNGTSQVAVYRAYSSSDPTNAAYASVQINASAAVYQSGITGTGTYLPMTFYTGGSERMRVDTSGNVGIGTNSPSSFPGKLSVIGDGIVTDYDLISRVSSSLADADRGFKQITDGTGQFSIYSPNGGGVVFGVGSSYTERMRIDTSGNVGIGTSSPSGWKLNVAGSILSTYQQIAPLSTSEEYVGLSLTNTYTSGEGVSFIDSQGRNSVKDSHIFFGHQADYGSNIRFATQPAGTNTDRRVERMRIDSSGNLLVGGTSAGYARFETTRSDTGNVGVGRFLASAASGYTGEAVQIIATQAGGTGFNLLSCYYSGGAAYAFKVRGDGTIYAQNTTVQSASDARFKENIVDSSEGLNVLSALRPVRFDIKEGHGVSAKTNQLGFIAQEVKAVFPDAVDVWGESDDPENPYLSLGSTALIPVLVKAIQEQQALITSLTERITALEAK